MIELVL